MGKGADQLTLGWRSVIREEQPLGDLRTSRLVLGLHGGAYWRRRLRFQYNGLIEKGRYVTATDALRSVRGLLPPVRVLRRLASTLLIGVMLAGCALGGNSRAAPTLTSSVDNRSSLANVRVSDDQYKVHVEPYLAVNPRDPRNLLATAQVFNQMSERAPVTFVSFDGGKSWHESGVLPMSATYTTGTDLVVAFTPQGIGFIVARLDGPGSTGIFVWRTDDGGRHFRAPVEVAAGSSSTINVDHPWLAVGAASDSGSSTLYVVWTLWSNMDGRMVGAVMLSRSFDDGQHFDPPRPVSGSTPRAVAASVVTAGLAGNVAVVYLDYGPFTGQGDDSSSLQHGTMRVVSSPDGGNHFNPPQAVGEDVVGSNSTVFALPQAATDPHDGTLYVSFAAYRSGTTHPDVMLTRSSDAGRTWTVPVRVNDDPITDQTDHLLPQLLVTPQGTVEVSYFALTNGLVDVYLARSTDHGAHFLPSLRINATNWRFALGVATNSGAQTWVGDYQGLAAAPGVMYLLWNDAHLGHLELYMAAVPEP